MFHKIHCILIDDDLQALFAMKDTFNKSDSFQVEGTFNTIDEALAYLQDHRPDLVVSDIEFPHQQLAYHRIAEFPDDIPLCLISGYPVYMGQSLPLIRDKASVIGILNKPLTPNLLQVLLNLYNGHKQRQGEHSREYCQTAQMLQNAQEQKLTLYRKKDDDSLVPAHIPVSHLIMAMPERLFRGLIVYCHYSPKPFILPNTTLTEFFEEIDSLCPGLCLRIGRTGIVNLLNTTTEGKNIISRNQTYSTEKLKLSIPVRLQQETKEKMKQFDQRIKHHKKHPFKKEL